MDSSHSVVFLNVKTDIENTGEHTSCGLTLTQEEASAANYTAGASPGSIKLSELLPHLMRDIYPALSALQDGIETVRSLSPKTHYDSKTSGTLPTASRVNSALDLETASTTQQAAARRKRPGRPKADYKTIQIEAKVFDDWNRAHHSGICKKEFAERVGMPFKELNRLLGRVEKRKKRSDK